MPDHREIEVKFPLTNPEGMRQALLALGAVSQGRHYELNIRLDDVGRSLSLHERVLRVRQIDTAQGRRQTLTLKEPRSGAGEKVRIQREIEVGIDDADALLAVLDVLGYRPYWRYEKRREIFAWRTVQAMLDEMPYGWFLEIEGSMEGIRALASSLDLKLEEAIPYGYGRIHQHVCQALGLGEIDLTFAAFAGIQVRREHYDEPGGQGSQSAPRGSV